MNVMNPFNRCPMCNGKNLNIHGYMREGSGDDILFDVVCEDCHYESHKCATYNDLVDDWNSTTLASLNSESLEGRCIICGTSYKVTCFAGKYYVCCSKCGRHFGDPYDTLQSAIIFANRWSKPKLISVV